MTMAEAATALKEEFIKYDLAFKFLMDQGQETRPETADDGPFAIGMIKQRYRDFIVKVLNLEPILDWVGGSFESIDFVDLMAKWIDKLNDGEKNYRALMSEGRWEIHTQFDTAGMRIRRNIAQSAINLQYATMSYVYEKGNENSSHVISWRNGLEREAKKLCKTHFGI